MASFLSKQDAVKEIILCGKDPVYFIDQYCKLSHPQRGIIPFKLWDFQKDLINDFIDYQHNIILKSRQLGVTWTAAAYATWLLLFHREKNIMVASIRFTVAAGLVKKVKFIIKNLPPWFDQLVSIQFDNKTSFTLSNGSEIKAASKALDIGRSESLSLLILDEAAHIDNMDEIWLAAAPTMAAGGRCIALSTPSGVGAWFYREYIRAEKSENEFHPIKLTWQVHPERDEEWERKERRKLADPRKFDQEYNASFLASGDTVIHSDNLKRIFESCKIPVIKTGVYDKNLYIWENYVHSENYILVADVARGDGTDYSAFHVLKLTTMQQVAEYKGKMTTDIYSKLIFDVGREYGMCMVVVENNNLGHEVCQKLISWGYPNVYYEEKGTHDYVPPYVAKNLENVIPGFTTSHTSRPLIIQKLEESIRRGFLIINSERTYQELETFVWNKGRPEAQREHNDDLVMALAIGCWVRDVALKVNQKNLDYKKSFLKAMSVTRSRLDTKIPGMIGYDHRFSSVNNTQHVTEQQRRFAWVGMG